MAAVAQEGREEPVEFDPGLLDKFFDLTIDLLCIADLEGRFCKLNGEWEKTLGYPRSELEGHLFIDFVHPDDREATLAAMARLQSNEVIINFENRYRHRDGSWCWLQWRSQPVDGFIIAAARDISAYKELVRLLEEGKYAADTTSVLLESVLDSIPDVIGIQHPDHRIIRYNRAGYEFLHVGPEDIAGKKCYELIGRDTPCRPCATSLARERKQPARVEKHLPEAGIWLDCRSYPVLDKDGELLYIVEHLRDITDLKAARQRVREAELELAQSEKMRAIGQLAGGIAHDFNNQLTGIQGYAELLQLRLGNGNPEVTEIIGRILQAAGHAADLTAKLLSFSRRGKLVNKPLDINEVAESVIDMLRRSIDKRISIELHLARNRCCILGDPSQVQNALLNLCLNARDAMPEGGVLGVATEVTELAAGNPVLTLEPGMYVRVDVRDTGTGIDEVTRSRIFEPFFTTKPEGKGTGMGLAAVYGTMKNHRGAVGVESNPGSGSVFSLYFPVCDSPAEEDAPAGRDEAVPFYGGKNVLLIDDEKFAGMAIRDMLTELGCRTVFVQNNLGGIEHFHAHSKEIDLVLLDMVMPDLTASEMFHRLREIAPDVRVLLMSGHDALDEVELLLKAGAAGFLHKPAGLQALREALAGVFRMAQ